jgi:hypothetical protein
MMQAMQMHVVEWDEDFRHAAGAALKDVLEGQMPVQAFPVIQAGWRPRPHFRGLPGVHSHYGPVNRSTTTSDAISRSNSPLASNPSLRTSARIVRWRTRPPSRTLSTR